MKKIIAIICTLLNIHASENIATTPNQKDCTIAFIELVKAYSALQTIKEQANKAIDINYDILTAPDLDNSTSESITSAYYDGQHTCKKIMKETCDSALNNYQAIYDTTKNTVMNCLKNNELHISISQEMIKKECPLQDFYWKNHRLPFFGTDSSDPNLLFIKLIKLYGCVIPLEPIQNEFSKNIEKALERNGTKNFIDAALRQGIINHYIKITANWKNDHNSYLSQYETIFENVSLYLSSKKFLELKIPYAAIAYILENKKREKETYNFGTPPNKIRYDNVYYYGPFVQEPSTHNMQEKSDFKKDMRREK